MSPRQPIGDSALLPPPPPSPHPPCRCDIVLVSYEQLVQVLGKKAAVQRKMCPLFGYGFWRIMVDEAQNVSVGGRGGRGKAYCFCECG